MLKIRPQYKVLRYTVTLVIFLLVGCILFWWSQNPTTDNQKQSTELGQIVPKLVRLESKVLFTGNSFWGRYTDDAARRSDNQYKFPFARLHEFEKDNYDAWVTGLECPTAEAGIGISSAEMDSTLSFNCDPNYLEEFSKWFEVVSLSNNHTDNMGVAAFEETKQALANNSIQFFGHYDPDKLEEACKVILLPVRAIFDNQEVIQKSLPIAACGYHGVFKIPSAESIAEISKYSEIMPVIAFPHSGAEYKAEPDDIKTRLYRQMIDAGADMVIGDHAHWVQSTEAYRGKLIVYSMGNFMFDQQFSQEVTRSAAIQLELLADDNPDNLSKWLDLGQECSLVEDCFDKIQDATQLQKYLPKYQFDFIATNNLGYQTHPAPDMRAALQQRLRWDSTISRLSNNAESDVQ